MHTARVYQHQGVCTWYKPTQHHFTLTHLCCSLNAIRLQPNATPLPPLRNLLHCTKRPVSSFHYRHLYRTNDKAYCVLWEIDAFAQGIPFTDEHQNDFDSSKAVVAIRAACWEEFKFPKHSAESLTFFALCVYLAWLPEKPGIDNERCTRRWQSVGENKSPTRGAECLEKCATPFVGAHELWPLCFYMPFSLPLPG